ncbi:UNVERIFIED_CONTAM: hypothetical protein FKN15_029784 [Acipenser sinensis]
MASNTVAMPAPVCLIENSSTGQLHVNQQALEILSQIDQPVVVVAIVGLYRTGKSYLMNKLAGKRSGFSLGATIQSHTKGIWMWCVPHPCKPGHTLVLLDTEGLGDVEKVQRLMNKLAGKRSGFSLGATIQSHTKGIWMWCVPHPCKPGHTLVLLDTEGLGDVEKTYNLPRSCIQNYFPSRKCFMFQKPTSTGMMARIEELTDNNLEPAFIEQTKNFCSHIFSNAETKTMIDGSTVTGRLLGRLTEIYVETIGSGQIVCLDNVVLGLSQIENSAAVQSALTHYKEQMRERVSFPSHTQKELSDLHGQCEAAAVHIFLERCFKDEDQRYLLELMVWTVNFQGYEVHFTPVVLNSGSSKKTQTYNLPRECIRNYFPSRKCFVFRRPTSEDKMRRIEELADSDLEPVFVEQTKNFLLGRLVETYLETIASGKVPSLDNAVLALSQIENSAAVQSALTHYKEQMKERVSFPSHTKKEISDLHGQCEAAAVHIFLERCFKDENQRYQLELMDQARRDAMERERRAIQENQKVLQQLLDDQERSYKQNMEQLLKKMKEDQKTASEEYDRVLQAKLREQKDLLESGFEEKAKKLENDVRSLSQKKEETQSQSTLSRVVETVGNAASLFLPGIAGRALGVATSLFSRFF